MRNRILSISLGLFVLAVFNVLFFLWTDSDRSVVDWLSYGFFTGAYLWFLATLCAPRSGGGSTYALTLPYVAGGYLLAVLATGAVLMLTTDSVAIALSVQLVLLAVCLVRFGIHHAANRATTQAVASHNRDVGYVRSTAVRIKKLVPSVSDAAAAVALRHLYDTVWCSPVRGTSSNADLQAFVSEHMAALESAVADGDSERIISSARKMESLFLER